MNIRAPNRASHRAQLHIAAPPQVVFPLLCPVREAEWVRGWSPTIVMSHSGTVERDCIFTTAAAQDESVWVVSRHDPVATSLEMFKFTPTHTVGRLEISVMASDQNPEGSEMIVATSYTAIGPRGKSFVEEFTEARYLESMAHWEAALNHFLKTGKKLA